MWGKLYRAMLTDKIEIYTLACSSYYSNSGVVVVKKLCRGFIQITFVVSSKRTEKCVRNEVYKLVDMLTEFEGVDCEYRTEFISQKQSDKIDCNLLDSFVEYINNLPKLTDTSISEF